MKTLTISLALLAVLGGCKKGGSDGAIQLNGAGATFPYPLYSKWMSEYTKTNPAVTINYQSIGSGGGIKQVTEGTVDFGASDDPMKDADLAKAKGKLLHIPTTLGSVVITYNLPGVPTGLKLTPEAVAGIFLGTITTWSDPAIAGPNAGVSLPDKNITVVHRSDGSGTTAVFTDYLAKVSPAWKSKVGAGKEVNWPTGLGGKGNEGVMGQVKGSPGAVGYVELAYAMQTKMPYASLKNKAGKFVEANLESISAAAAGAEMPEDYRVSITDAAGDGAYPIAAFTYLLVYQEAKDAARGAAIAKFLWWAIHDGQQYGPPLHYATLPPALVTKLEATLKTLTADGRPLLP